MNLAQAAAAFVFGAKPRSRGDEPYVMISLLAVTFKTPLTRG